MSLCPKFEEPKKVREPKSTWSWNHHNSIPKVTEITVDYYGIIRTEELLGDLNKAEIMETIIRLEDEIAENVRYIP